MTNDTVRENNTAEAENETEIETQPQQSAADWLERLDKSTRGGADRSNFFALELQDRRPSLTGYIEREPTNDTERAELRALLKAATTGQLTEQQQTDLEGYLVDAGRGANPVELLTIERSEAAKPQPWIIRDWLPANAATILTGSGGTGKTRLALKLAAGIACGDSRWLGNIEQSERANKDDRLHIVGLPASGWPVCFVSFEDSADVSLTRLRSMFGEHRDLPGLHYQYRDGTESLWAPEAADRNLNSRGKLTAAGQYIRIYCERNRCRLLILDPLAAAWQGNENDRGAVRQFMASWDHWSRRTGCAVLVIAHPPKPPSRKAETAAYSGSSDWHNACRSMLSLTLKAIPRKPDEPKPANGEPEPSADALTLVKSNYGSTKNKTAWLTSGHTDQRARWADWRETYTPEPVNIDPEVENETQAEEVIL